MRFSIAAALTLRPPTASEDILAELSTMRLISPDDGEAQGPVS